MIRTPSATAARLLLLIALAPGCPARRPVAPARPVAPPASPTGSVEIGAVAMTTTRGAGDEQRAVPRLAPAGKPPYPVRIAAEGAPEAQLVAQGLRQLLQRSGVFVSDGVGRRAGPGAAAATLRVSVAPRSSGLKAAARLQPDPATAAAVAWRVRGESVRDLIAGVATTLHRLYLATPGPYLSRIAFVGEADAAARGRQVFVIDFDGGGMRRISADGGPNILPAWSPRGDLVFTSYARGQPELVLIAAGASRARPLRAASSGLNMGAAFSADGAHIALAASHEGNTDIYVMRLDGSMRRRLTRHRGIDVSPTWSPDGQQIAFISDRSGSPQVWVMPARGREDDARRLTFAGSYNQEPDWCPRPGSTQLLYTRRHERETYEVHLLDVRSGRDRRLTFGGGKSPAWSPDCRLLAYSAGADGLWVMAPGGHPRFKLHHGRVRTPAWGPPVR